MLRRIHHNKTKLIGNYSKKILSITQKYNDNTKVSKYHFEEKNLIKEKNKEIFSLNKKLKNIIHYFLPREYPNSVNDNYLIYCKWSAVQYTSSSICGGKKKKKFLFFSNIK